MDGRPISNSWLTSIFIAQTKNSTLCPVQFFRMNMSISPLSSNLKKAMRSVYAVRYYISNISKEMKKKSYKVPVLPKPNRFSAEIRCQTAMTSILSSLFSVWTIKLVKNWMKGVFSLILVQAHRLKINISVLTKCATLIFVHFMTEPYIEQSELNLDSIWTCEEAAI